jgi:predicted RNA-binding Zn-ribbon protein involved in translation (DUF1610 family)
MTKLYEAMFETPAQSETPEGTCSECHTDMIVSNSMFVCPSCGITDLNSAFLVSYAYKKKSVYMRRAYFVERLNLIAGFNQSKNPNYSSTVDRLRRCRFNSIKKLRQHMKRLNMSKYYKFIYNIYFDIKGVRLIQLDRQTIQKLAKRFSQLQARFKTAEHDRKNFFSYSAVIYLIMKEHKIKGHDKMLLPRHVSRTLKLIKSVCDARIPAVPNRSKSSASVPPVLH